MIYFKKLVFGVFVLVILAGCEEQTLQLSEVINETDSEYNYLQLGVEEKVIDMGRTLHQTDSKNINEFVNLTGLAEVKEIGSKEAKEIYDEIYQDSRNEEKKVFSASIAVDEDLTESFFIYMSENGTILATRFKNGVGERHYVNATNSTALYDAAEVYYEENFEAEEEVQVLDLLEDK
ncbi:hypothetical protein [Bacillus sp. SG-1]|uniref:hypothetical protein n=1 Tax=Bacillus sp. SG-1 TaxID=161544 RepID=UPI00015453F3|nr:hypothetical protein [Bacillus sp. SG-1]EDL63519.1 hypothetical protein BSG1_13521 [Bacillus sp. SG-1]